MGRSKFVWRSATDLTLSTPSVHVWRACLDTAAQSLQPLELLLSADELARAKRLKFERDRIRFVAGRGILRLLLARYLSTDPAKLRFGIGARGKPALANSDAPHSLRFNVSHSQGLALYAVTCGREVGVDLEGWRAIQDYEGIAERSFSPQENEALRSLAPGQRPLAFLRCWVRKEALIKAIGDGLYFPLDSFDVTLGPGEPARVLRFGSDPKAATRWTLVGIDPGPGFVAALAIEGLCELTCLEWETDRS